MASWEELIEALEDYKINCNSNERLRKMQKDWSKTINFICEDNDIRSKMEVVQGEITEISEGNALEADIIVTTDSEIFCDMFWGELNPIKNICAVKSR